MNFLRVNSRDYLRNHSADSQSRSHLRGGVGATFQVTKHDRVCLVSLREEKGPVQNDAWLLNDEQQGLRKECTCSRGRDPYSCYVMYP